MVRFRKISSNYQIYSMFLSVHDVNITQEYGGEFLWKDGKFRKGSQSLAMIYNTHAIVYAAEGSHGIWPTAGQHVYKELLNGDTLEDHTSNGVSWYTWRKLKVTKYDPNRQYSGEFKFLEFSGRSGNKNAAAASQKRSAVNASLIMVQKVPPINHGLSLSNGRRNVSQWLSWLSVLCKTVTSVLEVKV